MNDPQDRAYFGVGEANIDPRAFIWSNFVEVATWCFMQYILNLAFIDSEESSFKEFSFGCYVNQSSALNEFCLDNF
jgi:hypothetical protein